jgi:hypothetical protein
LPVTDESIKVLLKATTAITTYIKEREVNSGHFSILFLKSFYTTKALNTRKLIPYFFITSKYPLKQT